MSREALLTLSGVPADMGLYWVLWSRLLNDPDDTLMRDLDHILNVEG